MRFKNGLQSGTRNASRVRGGSGRRGLAVTLALSAIVFAALGVGIGFGGSSTFAQLGGVWLLSRSGAAAATGLSTDPTVSDDGLRVAFASDAGDLVSSDSNGVEDVFLFERPGDSVRRLSLMPDGSQSGQRSMMPSLSPDGGWIALRSEADLVEDGDGPGMFLFDIDGGERIRVSTDSAGGRGSSFSPTVSRDGRRVLFLSNLTLEGEGADTWVRAFVWDRASGKSAVVSPEEPSADVIDIAISDDGATVAFATASAGVMPGDAPATVQVYVRRVMFDSRGPGAEIALGAAERISSGIDGSPGLADSLEPSLSADGRLVAFTSYATNLVIKDVNGVSDIFVRDRDAGLTTAVTTVVPPLSEFHPADSAEPDLSPDGARVAFASGMRDLVPGDRNLNWDIFVHFRAEGATRRVNLMWDGREADRDSRVPVIAENGVAFVSHAALAPEDGNDEQDVYWVAFGASPEHPTLEPHPSGTPTSHATATSDSHPTATVVHVRPTATGDPHATATSALHPTATLEHVRPTATADPHATATSVPHSTPTGDPHPTATLDPHSTPTHDPHPTATAVHVRPTATGEASTHAYGKLWFPACGTTLSHAR